MRWLFNFLTMEKYIHAFNLIPGMGNGILQKFWKFFGNFEAAWRNINLYSLKLLGFGENFSTAFLEKKKTIDPGREFSQLLKYRIVAFGRESAEYPPLLKEIPTPPFLLYRKGAPLDKHRKCIAMVGTRMPSVYGEKNAFELAEQITLQGGTVVSGLAFGIDAKSHWAAVKNHKPTVAILASGLMNITPPSHRQLAEDILKNGGSLISEYVTEIPSMKYRYLERNRLISGMCTATIIIEAKTRSGALITARHALEQNRAIYALPGDITRPQAQGCLRLIADGAQPIISIDQVLEDLGFQIPPHQMPIFSEQENSIFGHLGKKRCTTEDLLELTGLPLPKLNALLSSMEMKSYIHRNHAMRWEVR